MKIDLRYAFLLSCVMLTSMLHGQIGKGFEALNAYDFFKAKKLFQSSLKKEPAAANYGLARIHFDRLNHFHSLDSAYKRLQNSEAAFILLTEKKKIKYLNFGINDSSISQLKNSIYEEAFKDAGKSVQPNGYHNYIATFPGTPLLNKAIHLRDSFALNNCIASGNAVEFESFLQQYPDSEFRTIAEKKLDRLRFEIVLKANSIPEFENYLLKFPKSAFTNDVENAIYQLQVLKGTQDELYRFVKRYPKNINTPQAWEQLYALFTSDQRTESITKFKEQFPEFPFQEMISKDFERAKIRLFPVVQGERWGYADSTGKILIPYQFEDAEYFSENLALVQINGKKGFINKNGFKVVSPIYKEADSFVNGLSIVETDSATGIINPRGEWIVPPIYYNISGPFGDFYRVENNEKFGVISNKGKLVTEIKYEDLDGFSEGMAAFAIDGLAGFIDTTGKEIIAAQFEEAGAFIKGLAKVMLNEKYGMINTAGKFVIPAKFVKISNPHEGRLLVSTEKKCAYYDLNGKQIIPPSEICAGPVLGIEGFQEGLARIERKGKYGFIDKKGKLIIPVNFEQVGFFSNGLAPFRKKKKWGYINKSGKVIIEPIYDAASPFVDGKAKVKKDGLFGIISKEGKLILNAQYNEIIEFNGYFIASNDDLKYLYDQDLNQLLKDCSEIKQTKAPEVFQIIRNNKFAYYHVETKMIFGEELLIE